VGETKQVLNGRYRLLERLGGGGMSVVARAYDGVLHRYVAVKVLASGHTDGLWPRERIRGEAQAAARLSHPHVTAVYDYGEAADGSDERVPFVVMELLTGQNLAQRMASGPVPPGDALRITAEVATALAAAHAHGLVHCDIKPSNIMLTAAGAKVLDFGITASAGNQGGAGPDDLVVGTPAYLAPERFTRGEVSPAADVYALGLVLYRLLAGRPPWPATSLTDQLEAHASLPPEPLPASASVPAEVAAACLRCLAKAPEERPTAYGLAMVLAEAGGWRVVPAAGGGVVLAEGLGTRPAGSRVRRRLREALAATLTVSRRAAAAVRAGGPRGWRGRSTRIGAAAVVAVVGVVAGWGLPEGAVDRFPDASWAAPSVPRADPTGDAGLGTAGEQPGKTTDQPPQTGGAAGRVGGGGAGSDLVSEPIGGSSGSGSAPASGGGPGSSTDQPAPSKTTPPPAPKPAPDPTPTPRPTTAAPAPVEKVKSIVTAGGTIVVRCVGSTASIVSVSPLVGFGILDIDRGPGAEVSVALNALLLTVRVTVRCASGVPQASIQVG